MCVSRVSTLLRYLWLFGVQLVALLREVKYLRQRDAYHQPIPESAVSVFAQNDTYTTFNQNLDVIVSLYNL